MRFCRICKASAAPAAALSGVLAFGGGVQAGTRSSHLRAMSPGGRQPGVPAGAVLDPNTTSSQPAPGRLNHDKAIIPASRDTIRATANAAAPIAILKSPGRVVLANDLTSVRDSMAVRGWTTARDSTAFEVHRSG